MNAVIKRLTDFNIGSADHTTTKSQNVKVAHSEHYNIEDPTGIDSASTFVVNEKVKIAITEDCSLQNGIMSLDASLDQKILACLRHQFAIELLFLFLGSYCLM